MTITLARQQNGKIFRNASSRKLYISPIDDCCPCINTEHHIGTHCDWLTGDPNEGHCLGCIPTYFDNALPLVCPNLVQLVIGEMTGVGNYGGIYDRCCEAYDGTAILAPVNPAAAVCRWEKIIQHAIDEQLPVCGGDNPAGAVVQFYTDGLDLFWSANLQFASGLNCTGGVVCPGEGLFYLCPDPIGLDGSSRFFPMGTWTLEKICYQPCYTNPFGPDDEPICVWPDTIELNAF